jgi:aryl-alcohol dehydrogenase-like predicted oxidoreductase
MQNHYNLLYREEEREMMSLCQSEEIGVIPWSPLARGRLTRPWNEKDATSRANTDEVGGKLYRPVEEADRKVVDEVITVAARRGVPPAQVALAWILSKPYITSPIVGATKPQHLEDAIAALSVQLTQEEIAELESPYVPHPIAGFQ